MYSFLAMGDAQHRDSWHGTEVGNRDPAGVVIKPCVAIAVSLSVTYSCTVVSGHHSYIRNPT